MTRTPAFGLVVGLVGLGLCLLGPFDRARADPPVDTAYGHAQASSSVETSYRLHCSGCHGFDGTGSVVGRIPRFPGVIGQVLKAPDGRVYLVNVPGVVNAGLPDAETAAILNYVIHTWGGPDVPPDAKDFTAAEVSELRKVRIDDITLLRRKLGHWLTHAGVKLGY